MQRKLIVIFYGSIVYYLGTRGSSRMVGYAMNDAHTTFPPVHAQRVVNRNGLLTGKFHFGSEDMMQQLLENEGVKIENDKVEDIKKIFRDPIIELEV